MRVNALRGLGSALPLICAFATPSTVSAQPALDVFLRAGIPEDIFVNPELLDSKNDVAGRLQGKDGLRIVSKAEDADIEVRIRSRFLGGAGGAVVLQVSPTIASSLPITGNIIQAELRVGDDYVLELIGFHDGGSWRGAANQVADKIERWVEENAQRVRERRQPER